MSDRFKLVPEVHLFLLDRDSRVLLLRRCNTDYESGNYSVVAGHVEANEPVTAAAIREAKEEVGIQVQPSDIEVVGVIHRRAEDGYVSVAFFLTARTWEGLVVNAEPQNHDELAWRSADDLPRNMIPYVKHALLNYRHGKYYDSVGWDRNASVNRFHLYDRFKLISDVHVFLIKDDHEILLLRRCNTGFEDGSYSVVAGHVEAEEEIMAAAVREAKEEVGIKIRREDLEVVGVMHRRSDEERVSFFLTASAWTGTIVNAEPVLCDDLSWCSLDDLPPNTIPYLRQALRNYRNGTFYDGFGW
jgi:ADP-ribose pyrophosphatase YjhB (NUDIX family)